jgi:hypothetical protein
MRARLVCVCVCVWARARAYGDPRVVENCNDECQKRPNIKEKET